MKLTTAQIEVLNVGKALAFAPSTGNVWTTDAKGYSIKVRKGTFNALVLRGLLAEVEDFRTHHTRYFYPTDKGREALREQS